jgi:TldD protein
VANDRALRHFAGGASQEDQPAHSSPGPGGGPGPRRAVDPGFAALPRRELAGVALQRAHDLGAEHADFRLEQVRAQYIALSDNNLETLADTDELGLAVRVVCDGTWGFAAAPDLSADAAAWAAEQAVEVAKVSAAINSERIELAGEPAHGEVTWVSAYMTDPFEIAVADKVALLRGWSSALLADPRVDHVDVTLHQVKECKFYSDGGTTAMQQRVRLAPAVTAVAVDGQTGKFDMMRTLGPPAGRGYEYLTGTGWDFAAEIAELPELLAAKLAAPSVQPGTYDLVIDPSNLWLAIHESIGHATELDRALGYEAAYAGTSFATPDKLGSLRYGSPVMHVTGDRTAAHGLATVGFDDEGVAAQTWDIITGGIFTGYQLDRRMAKMNGFGRSNGCAFGDSPSHVPIQRMANVSLCADPDGPTTQELIAGVTRGIYIVGDNSWSIDMQRHNFQFTGQRFYKIENGQLAGQLRDVAYQASTTDFWNSMEAVGGPQTYLLCGAFNCGKGKPGQVAPVSHGCPSAVMRGIRILNTVKEAG